MRVPARAKARGKRAAAAKPAVQVPREAAAAVPRRAAAGARVVGALVAAVLVEVAGVERKPTSYLDQCVRLVA